MLYAKNERMNTEMPEVLIVILNYVTYELTLELIRELKSKLDYASYKILVVDNHSPNESARVLEKNQSELEYILYANTTNAGYAAGNNIGIRYGVTHGYAYTWILNNDVKIIDSGVLTHMVEIAEADKKVGCIGPRILSSDHSVCAPYCRRPTVWSMTAGVMAERRYRRQYAESSNYVYRVYGCCMLLKNSAMDEVECMDERTFLYGEEDILAERLMAKGYTTFYDAEVSVIHNESTTMRKAGRARKWLQMKETSWSMRLYLKEYRHFLLPLREICIAFRCMIILFR